MNLLVLPSLERQCLLEMPCLVIELTPTHHRQSIKRVEAIVAFAALEVRFFAVCQQLRLRREVVAAVIALPVLPGRIDVVLTRLRRDEEPLAALTPLTVVGGGVATVLV